MNAENDPPSAGKSVQKLLKLAPGVVETGDQTSINSLGNNRFMINGKLLPCSGEDLTPLSGMLKASEIAL